MTDADLYRTQMVVDKRTCILEFGKTSGQGTIAVIIVVTYDKNMYPWLSSDWQAYSSDIFSIFAN